ncbi:glycoside hydrolase family 43 protein [Paenibacillus puerhi]|uniref:glycoside hydrolase family 43 protein n=1 Tax=Paenibacillus puerhi TaxID=2692622 RepID=UPI0013597BB5|nr:glycoside hydrolase family 43 protein [Paenibacillus puerhi]
MTQLIQNPVLTGFSPDASIIRVGDDYYMATSTFEWFPGVQIHHSRDMVHWRLLAYPLTRTSQLDLRGIPSSGGIWAPALSYDQGVFYLIYTVMAGRKGVFKDLRNFLVTATDIQGPWSEPVFLNGSGFDPFLFHDTDGRKWLFNMQWDFRKNHTRFGGIVMQEYDPAEERLTGPIRSIYKGTAIGVTEAPMVYKRNGYYYLLVAEGGTGINHAATLARSRHLEGPYETDPNYPLLTTHPYLDHPLQQSGHSSLVETQQGEWYMAHICARMLPGTRMNPLGRETSIQACRWTEEGWLELAHGSKLPALTVPAPALEPHPFSPMPAKDDFDAAELGLQYQTLRVPAEESWLSLRERPGYLRMRGRESLVSWHRQSLVARRIQHFQCVTETCVEFEPEHFMQMAGIVCYYDEADYYYLRITHDELRGKCIGVVRSQQGQYDEYIAHEISAAGWEQHYLRAVIDDRSLNFYASPDGREWKVIGPTLDMGALSDEYGGKLGFTGGMVGLCAQDLNGTDKHADFDYFLYEETKEKTKEKTKG